MITLIQKLYTKVSQHEYSNLGVGTRLLTPGNVNRYRYLDLSIWLSIKY